MNFKLFVAIFAIIYELFSTVEALRCYSCNSVDSNSKCKRLISCRPGSSCSNEVRIENGNIRITKGCQQHRSCLISSRQNRRQCSPAARSSNLKSLRNVPPSICRSCCKTNRCNKGLFLQEAGGRPGAGSSRLRLLRPTITNVKVYLLSPDSSLITFTDINNHPASFYTVRLTPSSARAKVAPVFLPGNSIGGLRLNLKKGTLAYLATGLSSGVRYRINVFSRQGQRLQRQRIYTSFVTHPRPPSAIRLAGSSTTSISVHVQAPNYRRGDRGINYYSVSYRKASDPPSATKRIPNYEYVDVKTITNLKPSSEYIITAWTNLVPKGSVTLRSSKINITAFTNVPRVQHVEVAEIHATSMTWNIRVPAGIPDGAQEEFIVRVRDDTNRRLIVDTVIPGSRRTFTATGLTPQTAYSLIIKARTHNRDSFRTFSTPAFTHVRCYSCLDASSSDQCDEYIECPADAGGCLNEVRRRTFTDASQSGWYRVSMRCKQVRACNNSEIQDSTMQCNPERDQNIDPPEVCRCCCEGDLCNGPGGNCGHILGWLTPFRAPARPSITGPPFCPTPTIEFGAINCTNDFEIGSICDISCIGDRYVVGEARLSCLETGRWSSSLPVCEPIKTCSPITPSEGTSYYCTRGYKAGTVCRAKCAAGYELAGSRQITCGPLGEWTQSFFPVCLEIDNCQPDPCLNGAICHDGVDDFECECTPGWTGKRCERIVTCENLEVPENGRLQCTDGNRYQSRCRYSCNKGYKQHGSTYTRCLRDGYWSSYEPTVCIHNSCEVPPLRLVNHGKTVCSGYEVGDVCNFTCPAHLVVAGGPSSIKCQENKTWSGEAPCCDLPCPPHAKVDLYFLLDSSSSVGDENWKRLINFTISLLSQFAIGPEDMVVGIGRYNKYFDRRNEISFGNYKNFGDLVQKIKNLPYRGSGTRTGLALRYINRFSLNAPGNREDVPDIVTVITDGRAQDRVAIPARNIKRRKNTKVYAIGVQNKFERLDAKQLRSIASGEKYMHLLRNGYQELIDSFTKVLTGDVCSIPCQAKYEKREIFLRERYLSSMTGDAVDKAYWSKIDANTTPESTKAGTAPPQPVEPVRPRIPAEIPIEEN